MACASPDTLQRLLTGELTPAESDELRSHLLACSACQEVLNRLSDHAPLRHWATTGRQLTALDLETDVGGLLERLQVQAALETTPACATASTDRAGSSHVAAAAEPELIGSKIGPYTLLEQIGAGGMGVVYLADQQQPVAR